ncbi:MAG: MFS transporter [Dehalococcoidia bacterium]|nr:MFS transporter [Dehalococcoidia bacterium]
MRAIVLHPARPVFYGWYIVAAALVAQFVAIGIQSFAPGVFLKPMTDDLGWSRQSYSATQTVATAIGGVAGIFIGGFLDRRGPRLLMFVGGVIAGLSLMATAAVETYWQFLLLRGVAQTLGTALCGGLVVNVTVSRWFVQRRGTAISLASLGISLGGVLMVPLLGWWVDDFGWRQSWVMLGVISLLLVLPSAWVIRRSPEDMGLNPDGATDAELAAPPRPGRAVSAMTEVQWTRPEAVRTGALWFVILGYGLSTFGLMAFLLHAIPFLQDGGFHRGTAAMLLSAFSWSSLLSKFVWGPLMDRVHARHLSVIGFAMSGVAMALLPAALATDSVGVVLGVMLLYGFGMGGLAPLQETVWASYFGRMHLGSIRGVAMPFSIIFSAAGPLLGGAIFEQTGSYEAAFFIFAAGLALACVLVLLARPPKRRELPAAA